MGSPTLKSLAGFEVLTSAEASVFERSLEHRSYRVGDTVPSGESLLLLADGNFRLQVAKPTGPLVFASIGTGGLCGEMEFFVSAPVRVEAQAGSEAKCFSFDRRSLKSSFRYCRTGAVKFLEIFARSLSEKIRSANELLQQIPASSQASDGVDFSPSQLEAFDLQRLKSLTATRSYTKGSVLFSEGDASGELFVIDDGEVEILKKGDLGQSLSLANLGPGDFFGEMAFVDAKPRSAEAIALSPLRVHVLPSGSLDRAVEYNVGTALYLTSVICKIMGRRLNATLRKIIN